MSEGFVDYFLLLEVHMHASKEAIKASYRRLSAKHHPDNGGTSEQYILIQKAYNNLINDDSRDVYIKQWKEKKLNENAGFCENVSRSIDDLSFNTVRESINEYMFLIMNHEYEMAYGCLCSYNKSNIFIKDFITWQRLIGEVHELLEFECIMETFNKPKQFNKFIQNDYRLITFRIKIVELNILLNRVEEDFFSRDMIYEDGTWKVLLPNVDMKNIIKKYKNIVLINKKNKNRYQRRKRIIDERYLTKKISLETFMHNIEYEFLRYERYHRTFSMITLKIECDIITNSIQALTEKLIEKNTRKIDSFTDFSNRVYMIMLPETDENGVSVVVDKLILANGEANAKMALQIKAVTINEGHESVKCLVNALINWK